MARILILGGGFAGLITAERLSEELDDSHQITLVSPNSRFTFYPGLVDLAFGKCEADDITFDLGARLSSLGVRFVQGEVIEIDQADRVVHVAGGDIKGEIAYDHLVITLGRRLATERVAGFFENADHLLGIRAAKKFGAAMNEFTKGTILVGMCPDGRLPVPVCETAFALARRFEAEMSDGSVQIKVIFPQSLESAFGGAQIHKELEAAFARHRINVLYDVAIREITADEVISDQKHRIRYDLLMLVPPFRGHAILRGLGITDPEDYILVDGQMRIHGMDRAYAAGDIVAFSGPKFGHMAVRQAQVAADNLIAELAGREPTAEYYHEISTIIDAGGADSIFLRYGLWDDEMMQLRKGRFWSWAKDVHDRFWQSKHGYSKPSIDL